MSNLPKIYTATADQNGSAILNIDDPGTYQVNASLQGATSETKTIYITETNTSQSVTLAFAKLTVTAEENGEVTLTDGTTTHTYTSDGTPKTYPVSLGTWTCTMELDGASATKIVVVDDYTTYTTSLVIIHTFGVLWDGSSSPSLTRTDEAASFPDPDPYVNDGNHPGSSPFDNIMPWSGMVKVTRGTDVFVKIPKYWFKVTTNGASRKIQIANGPVEGFSVSPAHQDRGDGKGERDYIYVSRYHVSSGYKSISGVYPLTKMARYSARSGCSGRGTGYCQFDMMTLITIWYLYLVEFAHWNSQEKIGYGCGNNSAAEVLGASDTMPYHTGTMKSSRTTYGVGTQYRWIEDLWGNVMDWVDGVYFSSSNIYAIKNPANFSDSSGGTYVGTRPTSANEIKAWKDSTVSGYEWFVCPSETYDDSNHATYCCDNFGSVSSGVTLYFGGPYSQTQGRGIFCMQCDYPVSNSYGWNGARLQYLPSPT